jgi:hypothetical protein
MSAYPTIGQVGLLPAGMRVNPETELFLPFTRQVAAALSTASRAILPYRPSPRQSTTVPP